MPICKRDGFDIASSKDDEFYDNEEEVFFCETTMQIFRHYEDYFRHVMAINSTVWQCEVTGKENLTYAEALKSERQARKKVEQFKDILRAPVMLVIDQAKQSSLTALTALAFKFVRKRFFLNEEVSACHKSNSYHTYTVLEIIPPEKTPPPSGVYENTDELQYKLRRVGGTNPTEIVVPYEKVRRHRSDCTIENLQMFIRNNVTRVDGILRPKPELYKKYVTDRKITFGSIFIGKMPHFTPSKIKRPKDENSKKQMTLNKYLTKNEEKNTLSAQEQAKKEKDKAAEAMAKMKALQEEMERMRREKQEKIAEMEKQRVEKRVKLLEKIDAECLNLLTKTDDLERTDQQMLPKYSPIQTIIPLKMLGDAFMLREFMQSFTGCLSGMEVFRGSLSFFELARALNVREVAGPLSDILLILLGTTFDLQREEEEECTVEYLKLRREMRKREPLITMAQASVTHFYAKRHFSYKINDFPLDALTLSEVLRLHLLSSGAIVREQAERWRIMYRNGYSSSEDPGLSLRMQHPHILRALRMYTVFQLPFIDIMRILRCLMAQILTYSNPINLIEERMEEMAKARVELRALAIIENRRLAKLKEQKRTITIEHNHQCMDDEVKGNAEKRAQLEEKFNKKIAELIAQSDRERKKYDQQVDKLNAALFNFLVYLGMDRAYRKYYVLESMPGIFVEHPPDCMDTCLPDPPTNSVERARVASDIDLPRNRKDLRAYLLKMYTDEEKGAKKVVGKPKNIGKPMDTQENKENQENRLTNGLGLTNGHAPPEATAAATALTAADVNGDVKLEIGENEIKTEASPPPPPTQYQLYMCSGDPHNCIVHDDRNKDRQRWAYLYEKEDIEALINALNPLGERESQLKDQLTLLRELILAHVRKCPTYILNINESDLAWTKKNMITETNRKYNKSNFGFPIGVDLNEVMKATLIDRILQFENEIYTGDLGQLKVKDMVKWRTELQNGKYDAQVKLQWGNLRRNATGMANGSAAEEDGGGEVYDDDDEDGDDMENEANDDDGGKFARSPFCDPGESLGDTMEIDSEDSADDTISLHDSESMRLSVRQLASALLQVEQSIERRFIKHPFGPPLKDVMKSNKEALEIKMKLGARRLKQWEISLMESTSYSQVFLHLNVLHSSIVWARSTSKSQCQVCRRGSDPDKMLLCDECNGGTHMFCMKPKMRTVPEGNWYCKRCVQRLGLRNVQHDSTKKKLEKHKRRFVMEDEEEVESCSETSEVSSSASKTVNGRRVSGRRGKKQMLVNEIEEMLDGDDEDVEESANNSENEGDNEDGENNSEREEEESEKMNGAGEDKDEDDDDDDDNDDDANEESCHDESNNNSTAEDDDENVCSVCSYDGSDLVCIKCKDSFHLECINLKRPPRYNFICNNCKSQEERKRKPKANEDSSDDDDRSDSPEPPKKRLRHLRGSLQNGNSASTSNTTTESSRASGQRRSLRRNDDQLPLNNSILYELLEEMMKRDEAWPFLRPVSQAEVPDYHKIIKNPMDLGKVKSKLNMGKYVLNEEVLNDIQLIFKNCELYNQEGNEIYCAGASLEKFMIERCKDFKLPYKPSSMNL